MPHDTAPAEPLSGVAENRWPDIATMRDVARDVLADEETASEDLVPAMCGFVYLLVPEVQELIRRAPLGDMPAKVAQVAVDGACLRVTTPPGIGPAAVRRHARKVAASVLALCEHYEGLSHVAESR
ncbi:DUF6415 family natural product biosynthesis protein [Streptomyces sp. NPDC127084]|uniref:DUF6415 family natural product biosynthesis protein n=1 Tax=Streptomyces sp. NPDC127084 TaxID=3347133 RepID=UPI003656F507